jgi:hypothetical protein
VDIVRHPSEAEQVLRMLPGQLRGLRKLPPEAGLPASVRLLTSHVHGLQKFDACLEAHPDTDCCGAMLKLWPVQESGAAELQLSHWAAGRLRDSILAAAKVALERMEAGRKVFLKGRALALAQRMALYARDELNMSTLRIRVRSHCSGTVRACIVLRVSNSSVACLLCLRPIISI